MYDVERYAVMALGAARADTDHEEWIRATTPEHANLDFDVVGRGRDILEVVFGLPSLPSGHEEVVFRMSGSDEDILMFRVALDDDVGRILPASSPNPCAVLEKLADTFPESTVRLGRDIHSGTVTLEDWVERYRQAGIGDDYLDVLTRPFYVAKAAANQYPEALRDTLGIEE